jgi:hypothetical protein
LCPGQHCRTPRDRMARILNDLRKIKSSKQTFQFA